MSGNDAPAAAAWHIEEHACVDSTNSRALEIARARLANGESADRLAVIAQRQSAGRGQHGRTWESPPGGLYLSAIVTDVAAAWRDRLALAGGAAALRALRAIGAAGLGMWWPNDVMLADRKVGGILCESAALGEAWAGVIGVGINVSTDVAELPARATALAAAMGRAVAVREVGEAFLRALDETMAEMRAGGLAAVLAFLGKYDRLRGRRVSVQADGREFSGVAGGMDAEGNLLVTIDGEARAFRAATLLAVGDQRLRAAT